MAVSGPLVADEQLHVSPYQCEPAEEPQRPSDQVLTAHRPGDDIPSAVGSSGHRQGHDLASRAQLLPGERGCNFRGSSKIPVVTEGVSLATESGSGCHRGGRVTVTW